MKQLINTWYHPEGNILNNANRDYYMDNLKFVLMIFVVAGHFGLKLSHIPQIKYLTYYIYIFHMPCFIFISGYFAKNINAGGKLRVDKIMNIMFMYFLFKTGNVLLGSVSFLLLVPRCKLFFSKYGSRTMQIYMAHIWFRNALLYGGFFSALKKKPDYMSYLIFLSSIILTIILANKYLEKLYNSIIRSSLTLFQKIIK